MLCLLLCPAMGAEAQEYVISLEHWDVKDGLSHRQVNAGIRDKDSFLWFTTSNGLNRFDGYTFRQYTARNAGLPFSNLEYIAQDRAGMIWLLANTGVNNICVFNPATGRASRLKENFSRQLQCLYALSDGRIVFGSHDPNEWYVYSVDSGIRRLRFPLKEPYNFRFLTPHNTFWFSKDNQDFYEANLQGRVLARWRLPLKAGGFGTPVLNSGGVFGIPAGAGALVHIALDKSVRPLPYVPPAITGPPDHLIHTTLDGIVFRQGRLYHPQAGLLKDFVAEGWDDLEGGTRLGLIAGPGDMWLGGSFGLYHITIRKSLFRRYGWDARPKQDYHNGYRGLLVQNGCLFAAVEEHGLVRFPLGGGNAAPLYAAGAHGETRFTAAMPRADGTLLFVSHGWVHQQDPRDGSITTFSHTGPLPVWCLFEWSRDSLVAGTEAGLAWVIGGREGLPPYELYNRFPMLKEGIVTDITRQADGTLRICSSNGLYILDRKGGISARYSEAGSGKAFLPALAFFDCREDADGSYWLGTGSGLIHWNKSAGTYKAFTTSDGLSNDIIYAIYPDGQNRLWLPSDYGLMCFDKAGSSVKTYLTEDGISSNEFNRLSHCRDSAGNLYFGTINGVTAFNPADFQDQNGQNKAVLYPLAITAFTQFDSRSSQLIDRTDELLRTRRISLQPGERFFTLNLSLLNFTDPEHTTYYWRIDGAKTAWHAQQNHTLRFDNLPYGDYKLRLKAKSAGGDRSANELVLDLHLPPPFYQRPLFYMLLRCC